MFRHKKPRVGLYMFFLERTSCRFDAKKGPFGKTILYPNISYDLGMIRDEWPHIFFLSCRPKLDGSQQETATFWGILKPCLELTARKNPWTSMFGRWVISFWGNFGIFHFSFRECVYLSLDTLENDFASATFFFWKTKQCWFFRWFKHMCWIYPPPPSIPVWQMKVYMDLLLEMLIL